MGCETAACHSQALHQITPIQDIPYVTLIKNSVIYENVLVLTGQCSTCKTKYVADHERAVEEDGGHSRVYLNSAKYLKIGQSLWVDHKFSNGVVNGTYTFHASVLAYAEFWNNTFQRGQQTKFQRVTHHQVWQAFVQETTHTIASTSGQDLILCDGLAIDEVVKEAFAILGGNGVITAAENHSCSECTQEYKQHVDIIPATAATAATAATIATIATTATTATAATAAAAVSAVGELADEPMDDEPVEGLDVAVERKAANKPIVTMAVLDGIVMGPSVRSQPSICFKLFSNIYLALCL
jgi:hypothetical protein